jgi:hypothetical protein
MGRDWRLRPSGLDWLLAMYVAMFAGFGVVSPFLRGLLAAQG